MSRRSARRWALRILALLTVVVAVEDAAAAPVKSRVVLITPFDTSGLDTDDRWVGTAAAEALTLGLVQHHRSGEPDNPIPAFFIVDRDGVVRWIFTSRYYRELPAVSTLLDAAKSVIAGER